LKSFEMAKKQNFIINSVFKTKMIFVLMLLDKKKDDFHIH
jgi:hypothetical protein